MPEESGEKPKVILEAVAEEAAEQVGGEQSAVAAGVEELARVSETAAVPVPAGVSWPVEVTKVERGNGKWVGVWAVVGLLLGIGVGGGAGYVIWGSKKQLEMSVPVRKTEPTETLSPTPGVMVEVKRSELKVKVLNGSGVIGAAGRTKELLESLGYKDVATGNADRDDYEVTTVAVKVGQKAVWETVKADLENKYSVDGEMGKLEGGNEFDAVITLGGI
ncbi:LytR C-terminal domain-containing protein [Candidatus Amesbacteria bacterium]|nr:LytR C-terminal domain-containing protein [Candidatus Amesbacteria bacterium]MBI2587384.1 LytR C-terminal domain-containing protein [Candidatus Amesbacteria bacterium]